MEMMTLCRSLYICCLHPLEACLFLLEYASEDPDLFFTEK